MDGGGSVVEDVVLVDAEAKVVVLTAVLDVVPVPSVVEVVVLVDVEARIVVLVAVVDVVVIRRVVEVVVVCGGVDMH
jgi:hypothetical protein